ncbi:hypothetical protein [uncultured Aquimarina sp.]|uniref:hypothetical protein n=1 Tax=uncultured Aquimarina sp. TaxID=575652 RepID=UPI002632730A|nr:hypothetical protein [uncultured Aquimarina sp.]
MEVIEGKIKLRFEKPEYGWLLMNFVCGDYELKLHISNVPNNPIDDLRSALMTLNEPNYEAWGSQEVIFHLEPACYYLVIERNNENLDLKIFHSKDYGGKKYTVKNISGNYNQILMPIYRALMNFYSYEHNESDWSKTDEKLIQKLKKTVKNKST